MGFAPLLSDYGQNQATERGHREGAVKPDNTDCDKGDNCESHFDPPESSTGLPTTGLLGSVALSPVGAKTVGAAFASPLLSAFAFVFMLLYICENYAKICLSYKIINLY